MSEANWNYRMTRQKVEYPTGFDDGYLYGIREVDYEDGKVTGWAKDFATFAGDTPGEVWESINRAMSCFPGRAVLDLVTREDVRVTCHGKDLG